MTSSFNSQIEQINLSKQLKEFKIDIEQMITKLIAVSNYCRTLTHKKSPFRQIQVMQHRLNLEIEKYKQTINKIENKVVNSGGIKCLKSYFKNHYQTLIRQSHQLISMCGNQIKLPNQQDFKKIKKFQQQMDDEWQRGKSNNKSKINQNQSSRYTSQNINEIQNSTSNQIQSNQCKASAQIQQQFLAIRMIAYKMYEKHNGHHHQKIHHQVQVLQEQQEKLRKQLIQMKQIRLSLINEEKKLQTELNQLKKINELVGRRYFIEQTNLTKV